MNEPRNDDERLSALLDGRVDERQRRELLAHLATSEDDYEVFAHTAIVLRQLEEQAPADEPVRIDEEARLEEQARADEDRRAGALPVPPSTRTGGWRKRVRWTGVAAGVAVLALAAVWVVRNRASATAEPVRLAARLAESGQGLPAAWPGPERWGAVRGDDMATPASPEEQAALAARAGAMLVDLAVVARARDTAATRRLANQAARRLEPRSGRGTPLLRIAERPGAPPDSLERLLARATDRLAGRLGRAPLQLGAWTEAALLAANRRDAAFFRLGESRAMLKRAEQLTRRDPAARAAVDDVRAAGAVATLDWTALAAALGKLQRELSR
ncbi:MAG: zf-HC2 domain-containing protein [Longimicrobiaceae bacterium]